MDDIKDIQKTDSISKFIDQYNVRTNPFGENRAAERAYRRAERIAAALYLLTNHIPQSEVVRENVRASSNQILSDVLLLRDEMRAPQSQFIAGLQSRIRFLISLVRIMTVSGFVSLQNATTVVEALDELGTFLIASQRSILSENISLSREDLVDVRTPSVRVSAPRPIKDTADTGEVKDMDSPVLSATASSRPVESIGNVTVRVQNILEILRVGGSLGIRDISSNLPEYSEKMIQRELLDLVARGRVRKTGLKRWSRYSLAA